MESDHIAAHKHSFKNHKHVISSDSCGCFYCIAIFAPSEITDWISDDNDETAQCPRCGIDSVIRSAAGFPIERTFLKRMNAHWF
jgi:hypothetical protein